MPNDVYRHNELSDESPDSDKQILDVKDMVALLNMNAATVLRLARTGQIPGAKKFGRQWRFLREEVVKAFLE